MADLESQHPGEALAGQIIDRKTRLAIPYSQRMQTFKQGGRSPNLGNVHAEVTVVDANSTEDKIFDYTAFDTGLLELFFSYPGFISFDLPEELIGLTSVFSTSKGVGAGLSVPHASSTGSHWSISVSASNHASSSLDYIPDLQPVIKTFRTQKVPSIECYFFTNGTQSRADILTLLSTNLGDTVTDLPAFRPLRHSFTLKGQSLTLSASAQVQLSASAGAGTSVSDNSGYDYSIETRTTVRSLDIGPFLHGALSISPYTESDTLTVTATASVTGTGSLVGSASGGTTVPTQTVTALITPHTLSASTPSAVPTSGLYLINISGQASEGDLFLQLASVVDFSYFA